MGQKNYREFAAGYKILCVWWFLLLFPPQPEQKKTPCIVLFTVFLSPRSPEEFFECLAVQSYKRRKFYKGTTRA